nr:MAG TPA: hypothetical protein [Caudoviricetes sp.]
MAIAVNGLNFEPGPKLDTVTRENSLVKQYYVTR